MIYMISCDRYSVTKKGYESVPSWSIWASQEKTFKSGVGDLSIFDNIDLSVFNPYYDYVCFYIL